MAQRGPRGIETHLFVNKPISPNAGENTATSTQLDAFSKHPGLQQPDQELEQPSFLEALLGPPSLSLPPPILCLSRITYRPVPPQLSVGMIEFLVDETVSSSTSIWFWLHTENKGTWAEVQVPFQVAKFWKKTGCRRSMKIFYSLSTGRAGLGPNLGSPDA